MALISNQQTLTKDPSFENSWEELKNNVIVSECLKVEFIEYLQQTFIENADSRALLGPTGSELLG